MGGHYLGQLTDRERRIASGFAGGIGGTGEELCGAFSLGVAVISALCGRTSSDEDIEDCQEVIAQFRQRFLDRFGTLRCKELRESGYGAENLEPCSKLVERDARILVEVIEEYRQAHPE